MVNPSWLKPSRAQTPKKSYLNEFLLLVSPLNCNKIDKTHYAIILVDYNIIFRNSIIYTLRCFSLVNRLQKVNMYFGTSNATLPKENQTAADLSSWDSNGTEFRQQYGYVGIFSFATSRKQAQYVLITVKAEEGIVSLKEVKIFEKPSKRSNFLSLTNNIYDSKIEAACRVSKFSHESSTYWPIRIRSIISVILRP